MERKITVFYYSGFGVGSASKNHTDSLKLRHIAACQYTSLPYDYPTDAQNERGKPYFSNLPELHFSVSHSGNVWICAFSDHPVGCDIERHRDDMSRIRALAKRWLSEDEQIYLENNGCTPRSFADIWVRKEAYVKLLGCGIDSRFRSFSTVGMREIKGFVLPGYENEPFSAAVAAENTDNAAISIDFRKLLT